MHELSLALEVCRIAETHVGAERLADVREIGLEVGDEAGVETGNLEFCLQALLSMPPFGRARPVIRPVRGFVIRVDYLEVDDGDTDDRGSREGDGPERRDRDRSTPPPH